MSKNRLESGMWQICRTCLLRCGDANVKSVFAIEPSLHVAYSAIIKAVTGLDITQDGYTDRLCSTCQSTVMLAYKYKLMAIRADKKLRSNNGSTVQGLDEYDTKDIEINHNENADQFETYAKKSSMECVQNMLFEGIEKNEDFEQEIKVEELNGYENNSIDLKIDVVKSEENGWDEYSDVAIDQYEVSPKKENDRSLSEVGESGEVKDKLLEGSSPIKMKYRKSKRKREGKSKSKRKEIVSSKRRNKKMYKILRDRQVQEVNDNKYKNFYDGDSAFVHYVPPHPRCGVCYSVCENQFELIEHYNIHYSTGVLSCKLCSELYLEPVYLRRHLVVAHAQHRADMSAVLPLAAGTFIHSLVKVYSESSEDMYISVCPQCGQLTMSSEDLQHHNRTRHAAFKHVCQYCNKMYVQHSTMESHQRFCLQAYRHVCNICNEKFTSAKTLKNHIKSHSTKTSEKGTESQKKTVEKGNNEDEFKCDVCNLKYASARGLTSHKNVHRRKLLGRKPYECDICHRTFYSRSKIIQHIKEHDPSYKNEHLCNVCGRDFTFPGNLIRHMKDVHSTEKPYKCSHCNRGFKRARECMFHERIHTGEKPHACTLCDKSFRNPSTLTTHMLTHTGVKRHKCKYCGRKFAQHPDMRRHELRHMGMKPYPCTLCGEGFNKASLMREHRETCTLQHLLEA